MEYYFRLFSLEWCNLFQLQVAIICRFIANFKVMLIVFLIK